MRTHAFHKNKKKKKSEIAYRQSLVAGIKGFRYRSEIWSYSERVWLEFSGYVCRFVRRVEFRIYSTLYGAAREKRGRGWTKGNRNREEKESRTTGRGCGCGERKSEIESSCVRLSIRPITFTFSSRPSYHRTRIITSRSLFARSAFPAQLIFSFSSLFSLSLSFSAFSLLVIPARLYRLRHKIRP